MVFNWNFPIQVLGVIIFPDVPFLNQPKAASAIIETIQIMGAAASNQQIGAIVDQSE